MATPPDARLIAALGSAIEPVIDAKESVHTARIGGIGVINNAILENERAHALPVAVKSGNIHTACICELGLGRIPASLLARSPPEYVTRGRFALKIIVRACPLLL